MAKKKERKVLRPTKEWARTQQESRRFKWVALSDGSEVCVWSSKVPELLKILSTVSLPEELQEVPGLVEGQAFLSLIMLNCYDDEPPEGKRIFDDTMAWAVNALDGKDAEAIVAAVGEVNGAKGAAEGLFAAFTGRPADGPSPGLPTGASKNSDGSPPRSNVISVTSSLG